MRRPRSDGHRNRRGLAIPEWFCILGLVTVALCAVLFSFGHLLSDDLNTTAEGIGDPSTLLGQISTRGNNGVGNGEDPQPPGDPPINDGPGTGPGNPGNKGGAKK